MAIERIRSWRCAGRRDSWGVMRRMSAAVVLAVISAAVGHAMPLEAQRRVVEVPPPLMAFAHNDLMFGNVFPGISVTIPPRDLRAGLFEVSGPGGASVRVEFLLPAYLVASHGAHLPVAFGSGDGFATTREPGSGQYFNPRGPLIGALGALGKLFVQVGGTALPARPQAGGAYRATIYLTVYDLGS
jgi:hypothetical protein